MMLGCRASVSSQEEADMEKSVSKVRHRRERRCGRLFVLHS